MVGGRCPIIGSPPEKSPPTDNLPAKIRPARAERIVTGELSVGGAGFSGGADPIIWKLFIGPAASNILIRGRHIKFVIISSWTDFSWGRHFNVTPATTTRSNNLPAILSDYFSSWAAAVASTMPRQAWPSAIDVWCRASERDELQYSNWCVDAPWLLGLNASLQSIFSVYAQSNARREKMTFDCLAICCFLRLFT